MNLKIEYAVALALFLAAAIILSVFYWYKNSSPTPTTEVAKTEKPEQIPTNTSTQPLVAIFTSTPTVIPTSTDTPTPTVAPTSTNTSTPTVIPTSTDTSTPTATPTSTDTSTATPTSTNTFTPTVTSTPTSYPAPVLEKPINDAAYGGPFVDLSWNWESELAENEYFEVRLQYPHQGYYSGIAWVKQKVFPLNLENAPTGQYSWCIAVVRSDNGIKSKGWPNVEAWEGIPPVQQLSIESQIGIFELGAKGGSDNRNDCVRDRHGYCK